MKLKNRKNLVVNLLIAAVFITSVILPIISMFSRVTAESFREVTGSVQFGRAVWNSLTTSLTATMISLILALLAAWCVERTRLPGKNLFSLLFVAPMLIPSMSHAFGLIALFGTNGLITRLLHVRTAIYGFNGIVFGAVMYSFPFAYVMFTSILQYEDQLPYRAAEVMGIPRIRQFTGITLPYLKKAIITAFFAIFTMTITDYGVPIMIGGQVQTLPVLMYNKAVAMTDYSTGSVIGIFLLIPAIVAFVADLLNPETNQNTYAAERFKPRRNRAQSTAALVFSILLCVMILSPVLSFCFMVFEERYPSVTTFTLYHIEKTLNRGALTYLGNSLLYAVLTSTAGTVFAFFCAYETARVKERLGKLIHLISLTSMAIPGIVLGLSYIIFFHGSAVYGTIWIVVIMNCIHFFSSPYLMMYNTLGKVNPNLEAAGSTLGIKRWRIVRDVILPKVSGTVLEMFSYFFVNSLVTISAVSFLSPPSPKPLSLLINQFEAQRQMESAAFVSLLIFLVNVLLRVSIRGIKKNLALKKARIEAGQAVC